MGPRVGRAERAEKTNTVTLLLVENSDGQYNGEWMAPDDQ